MGCGCQIGFSCLAFAPALSYQKKKVDKSFSYAQRICCQVSNNVRTVEKYFETVDKSVGKMDKPYGKMDKPYGKMDKPYGKVDKSCVKMDKWVWTNRLGMWKSGQIF